MQVPAPAEGAVDAVQPARVLGLGEGTAVTFDAGVWVPRLTGTATVGVGGTTFNLDNDLAVEEGTAGVAGEFAVGFGRWRVGGIGFSTSVSGTEAAPRSGTFGSTAISAGDTISGSYSAWMAGAEVGWLLWRPMADSPWPWSAEGANRAQAERAVAPDGRPLFDVQLLLLGGGLVFHYEQQLENLTAGGSSGFDRTVAGIYGGAGLDIRLGFDGRVPLVQELRIYGNFGIGPSIPDGETLWMVRVGLALMLDRNVGVEFGYRLFDFDLVDGPSNVNAGLRGIFGGASIRF